MVKHWSHNPKMEGSNPDISGQNYKTFWGVIYATSAVFLYDFYWDYADSDVIMS